MSSVFWTVQTAELAPVFDDTLAMVVAGSNHGIYVDSIEIDIDPASASEVYYLDLRTYSQETTAAAGGAAITAVKKNPDDRETLQVSGRSGPTTEGVSAADIDRKVVYISGSSVIRVQWNFSNPRRRVAGGHGLGIFYSSTINPNLTPRFNITFHGEE
jgi:hypothetical protein